MNKLEPTRLKKSLKRCLPFWRKCLATFVALVFLSSDFALAGDASSLEFQVKGACLVKFGMFVEWPPAANGSADKSPFVIGILGNDPFGKLFDDSVAKEKVNGRQVLVKRGNSAAELLDCQIVFISYPEMDRVKAAITQFATHGVLTVSDAPGFARMGGMVGFIREAGKEGVKVRFEINTEIAGQSGLKLSSKLLQVGRVVTSGKPDHG